VVTRRCTLTKATAAVIGVVVLRLVAGVWITAAVVAVLAVGGLVAGWAAIERRAFPRRSPAPGSVLVGPQPAGGARHVAFARALAVVAAAYLAACERDEQQETGR
jgi:hypothetical protein